MTPFLTENYGNPSSVYAMGRQTKQAIEDARGRVAHALNADAREIFFTGSGSEADNWAIKGLLSKTLPKGKNHVITTNFEHHAVLHTLEKSGLDVTYIPVDSDGLVNPGDVANAIKPTTALVSIMYANNEIGTVQPIPEIGAICRERSVIFHTDAVQAVGSVPIDVAAQNIDLLSLSAHKFYGPKGVGALYCRKGISLANLIDGGGQENARRAGTENTAGIVGLGTAIELACKNIPENSAKLCAMRDRLFDEIAKIPHSRINGHRTKRLPGNANFSFVGVEGESLLLMLDLAGICASSGSACTSGSLDPSHVLLAIGLTHEVAHGSLRISLGKYNSMEDVDYILEQLPPIIEKLRSFSPLWEKISARA